MDVPTVVGPEQVDHRKHTILVTNVKDVGAVVVQENIVFTIFRLLHEGEHHGQIGFNFRFATKFSDEHSVSRHFAQLVVTERLFADGVFDFAGAREEPVGEDATD